MRAACSACAARWRGARRAIPDAIAFRYEVTTAYHTRHLELLMVHQADHAALPKYNEPMPSLGRLSPG